MQAMRHATFLSTKLSGLWSAIALLAFVSPGWTQQAAELADAPVGESEADPSERPDGQKLPKVEKLEGHRYRMGTIEFNGKTREIRVPAQLNMREGILEFVIVHGDGKIHESLLVTEVPATHLQLVMKLCRYRDGEGDTFDAFFPDEEKKGEAGARERGEPVNLRVEWQVGGKTKSVPVGEWIYDRKREAPMLDEPWVYSGSYLIEGDFMAEIDGTLAAIYLSRGAMLNTMTDGSDDDERWLAHGDNTPEVGTEVILILSPAPPVEQQQ